MQPTYPSTHPTAHRLQTHAVIPHTPLRRHPLPVVRNHPTELRLELYRICCNVSPAQGLRRTIARGDVDHPVASNRCDEPKFSLTIGGGRCPTQWPPVGMPSARPLPRRLPLASTARPSTLRVAVVGYRRRVNGALARPIDHHLSLCLCTSDRRRGTHLTEASAGINAHPQHRLRPILTSRVHQPDGHERSTPRRPLPSRYRHHTLGVTLLENRQAAWLTVTTRRRSNRSWRCRERFSPPWTT